MYTKRIQIDNYGPIDKLDITFPFEGITPKPVVLVGENGSGKSIFLSHIVNGLISAKDLTFPGSPEVETGKVFKMRSPLYIKSGNEYYFSRVDFENGLFLEELRTRRIKQEYPDTPAGLQRGDAQNAWNRMSQDANDHFSGNMFDNKNKIEDIFSKNCVLYFPHNRFEEPAWLNEKNLKAQPQYMDLEHISGSTNRQVVNYSPLHDNQNWLFEVIYDRVAFEVNTRELPLPVPGSTTQISLPLFLGYSGNATSIYEVVLQIVRSITKVQNARFGVGKRHQRVISIQLGTGQLIPNIFQLSSGEISLLNMFLSILQDFDLCGTLFSDATGIRGIVIVDEIDLHLHATHQYDILPKLIRMFPNIQFVVTTHSPLFVLGMKKIFGDDGFALYRLPQGQKISPEEFSEFGEAYQVLTETEKFINDTRTAIENAQKPIVYLEGETDRKYLEKASQLLGKELLLEGIEIRDGRGTGNLNKIWKGFENLPSDFIHNKVLLLYDCEENKHGNRNYFFRRTIPIQGDRPDHPVRQGIENLFSKKTLEKARSAKQAFIDIDPERTKLERGKEVNVPETWTVNKDEKANLCNWLCENGTQKDFQHFEVIFKLLEDILCPASILAESESL